MTAARSRARLLPAAALGATLLCLTAACGAERATPAEGARGRVPHGTVRGTTAWKEPAAYAYTLTSTSETLAGTFRVEVRDGRVTKAVGLDEDSRRQARRLPARLPTIGELLRELEQAREHGAETADATYAADGRPVRISLDWDANAVDDEALYLVGDYAPHSAG
ncbi:DUF6174 domain-containing protein [Streptomyces sp. NPDC006193]|uniref:DUF6174 domain-containing protein n=1 Tax=Streptomyces sp. NPDC006193 TaxID=3155717 RepID=UPI0033AC7160